VQIAGFIFGDFADGGMVQFHDVQDTIVSDEPAEAPEMTVELLLLPIIAILVDFAHHDESTGVQMARRLC
jgi:hypothetical protein